MPTSIELLIGAVNNAKAVIDKTAKDLGEIAKQAKGVGDSTEQGAKKAEGALVRLKNTAAAVRTQFDGMSKSLDVIGDVSKKLMMAGVAITAAVFFPIKEAADFASQLLKVRLASGATREQIAGLRDAIKDLDNRTTFSAIQFGQVALVLAKFGMQIEEVKRQLPGLWEAAYAGGADLVAMTQALSGVIIGMGMDIEEMSGRAAQFAVVARKTNVDMLSLVEGVRELGPIAQASGTSLEDLLAILGVLGKLGESAPAAQIFRMIDSLQNQTKAASKALNELGVYALKDTGEFKGLVQIFTELGEKQISVSQASDIFGARLGKLAIALVSQKGALREFRKEIDNAEEGIKKITESMKEDARLAITRLMKTFSDLGEALASDLIAPITKVLNVMSDLLDGVIELIRALGPVGPTIFGVVTVVGILALGLGALGFAIKSVGFLFIGIKTALLTMGSVMAVSATTTGALTAVVIALKGALLAIAGPALVAIGALAVYKLLSEWKGFLNVMDSVILVIHKFASATILKFKEVQLAWKKLWGTNTADLEKEIAAQRQVVKGLDEITDTFKKAGDAKKTQADVSEDSNNKMTESERKAAAEKKRLAADEARDLAARTKYNKELAEAVVTANIEREKAAIPLERSVLQARYQARLIQHQEYFDAMIALQNRETAVELKVLQKRMDELGKDPGTKTQRITLQAEIDATVMKSTSSKEALRVQAAQVMKDYWAGVKTAQSKEQLEASASLIKGDREALENANREKLLTVEEYYTQLIEVQKRETANQVAVIKTELAPLDAYFDVAKVIEIDTRVKGAEEAGKQVISGYLSALRIGKKDATAETQRLSQELASQWTAMSATTSGQIIAKQQKEMEDYDIQTQQKINDLKLREKAFGANVDFEERLKEFVAIRDEGRRRKTQEQELALFEFTADLERQKLSIRMGAVDDTIEGERQAAAIKNQIAAIDDSVEIARLRAKGLTEDEIDSITVDKIKTRRIDLNKTILDLDQKEMQMKAATFGMLSQMFTALYEEGGKQTKAFFYLSKAAALAQAIINVAQGVTASLKVGGVWGTLQAVATAALGAIQISKIISTKPSYAGGGLIKGRSRVVDDKTINVTAGEYVVKQSSVGKYGVALLDAINKGIFEVPENWLRKLAFISNSPKLAYATGGLVATGRAVQERPIQIVNIQDPREIDRYMYSAHGEDMVLNVISSRAHQVSRILRG